MKRFLAITAAGGAALAAVADGAVDFATEIRPLLEARCHECHSEKKSKADLRLDIRVRAMQGGESGPAFIAGKAEESRLIQRVTSADPDEVMPPKGERLTPEEIDRLRKWINEGAVWPESLAAGNDPQNHWAFKKPVRPAVPGYSESSNKSPQSPPSHQPDSAAEHPQPAVATTNPIDAFVAARLKREGLAFSPVADRGTLMRRLHLDLIGLPPSIGELDEFRRDRSAGAYERLVDRLLDNPHFGERWARHWLDAARYADYDGFEKDQAALLGVVLARLGHQCPERDLPYDQFIIDQIAGDLLPDATQEQIVATGFLRQLDGQRGRRRRSRAISHGCDVRPHGLHRKSVLGLTIQCAQCHNHKFDPISTRTNTTGSSHS